MTSILAFRINNGKQMIVVGDTQHTYSSSTVQGSKIFQFNNLLYCGSGHDRVIDDVYANILHFKSQNKNCANKIIDSQNSLIMKYADARNQFDITTQITPNEVLACSFMIINIKTLKGNIVNEKTHNLLKDVRIIGSGEEYLGTLNLSDADKIKFNKNTKNLIFNKILEIYSHLGRQDPFTGHPNIFDLEVYVLTKNKQTKKYTLSFRHKKNTIKNYYIIEEK